ncbi:MAG: type I restriction endonuclease subunit S [Caldilineaceae bacterium SB0675_bin_29]|uniref:Type I restriction endonuclease subunit S n=1 Tax=Caldilineaceae bacterium SB0675_bin_29 TaxID=2605266 RepID=A0A6B1FX39_9CHLR|nr:type I restriction endonuclease subunit S [Caldilineaceae bacterium SB0675_bin_29]
MRNDPKNRSLPVGWVRAKVEQVCLVNPRTFAVPLSDNCEVSFVPMAAIEAETGVIDLSQIKLFGDVKKGYTKFSDGDVLFAKITPCMENGKIAIANGLKNGSACGTTELHVLRPFPGLSREYLRFFLLRTDFRKQAQRNMAGTAGQLRVPAWFIEQAHIPLPPHPEQRRIVAEIEKQFTRLEAAEAALRRIEVNLKRYRASVLKAASEGKLVPTEAELAEAEGRDYEHAEQLLERILVERRARWESQEKRRGKYREPVPPDTSDLSELPAGWIWSNIGEAFEVFVGATPRRSRPEYWGGDISWVSSSEVAFNRIKNTRECTTEEGLNNSSMDLHPPGTVLLGMIGEGKTRGQVSILDISACNSQNSAAIRASQSKLPPEYLFYYLWGQYDVTRQIGSGNNQPALNKSRVQEIPFPVPPIGEQHRIVAEVESRLSIIQQAETTVEICAKRVGRLRQSILNQAFSGQLVPQDSCDEPASTLLERIKTEREAARSSKASRPRPTRRRSRK